MYNPFSLKGKTILITGASSGIGRSIAIECSKMGANVIITGRNKERLDETYNSLEGNNHKLVQGDLNIDSDIISLVESIGNIDGIVLCAGIIQTIPIKFLNRNVIEEILSVNFTSSTILLRNLLQKKKLSNEASIVFISSLASLYANVGNSVYSASKGAINSFAKVLALELSSRKIRVNCILPAMINTELLDKCEITKDQFEIDEKRYPLGYGKPDDVAFASVYLLSDATKWMTGIELILDGGVSIQ